MPRASTIMDPESLQRTDRSHVDSCLHRIVLFIQATDRGERGGATLYNVSHGLVFVVLAVGFAYLFGREDASKLQEAFGWIVKVGRRIDARVH